MSHTNTLDPELLSEEIDQYDLKTDDGIARLEYDIRRSWTVWQILSFYPFLHGGRFVSDTGRWVRNMTGHVTQTHQEDSALERLFDGLRNNCHHYIGAASVLEMYGAQLLGGYCFPGTGEKGIKSLFNLTLNELGDIVPDGLRERIEKDTKPIADQLNVTEGKLRKTRGGQSGADKVIAERTTEIAELKEEIKKLTAERDAARLALVKMMERER